MKMKKVIALSCAAAMVLGAVPVFAAETDANEDISGSITIWEHEYSFEEALKAVIDGFQEKYPNVEVDYEIKASDYQQVLATALQSGEGPDLFWTNGTATDIMLGYVKNGMVADLSDSVDFSLMTEDAMKLSTVDDKQYSVPWLTMDTRACFYNKDMFEENGWEVPGTFSEFEDLLAKIKEAGINVPVVAGIMPITNAKQVSRAVQMSGTSIIPYHFKMMVDAFGDNPEIMKQAGIIYASEQIIDLIANGVKHIHVYTMNKPDIAEGIMNNISEILK